MPQTLNEAARAARQHSHELANAKERQQELRTTLAAADARVTQLEQAEDGIYYALRAAALGEVEAPAPEAANKH